MKPFMIVMGCLLLSAVPPASADPRPVECAEGDRPAQEPAWQKPAREQLEKAYPEAEEGMVRHVLYLEPKDNEADYQVELIVGKTVETDAVNRYFFAGGIEQQTIKGWGYTKYVVDKGTFDRMVGTLIAVSPDEEMVERFVRVSTEGPYLVRYNSRLPVVVYVPEGGEVKYRLWHAEGDGQAVGEG